MRRSCLCLAVLLPAIALPLISGAAEPEIGPPMTGAQFDAYTTGKTLTYSSGGQSYGAEQYLPGRRVLWAFTEDICREGIWYEQDGQICFVYDYDPVPQCWVFWQDQGLNALFTGQDGGTRLHEQSQDTRPLPCAGPEVGV